MSLDITRKIVLIDERDLTSAESGELDFKELQEEVADNFLPPLGDDDIVAVLAVTSERFSRTALFGSPYTDAEVLRTGQTWTESLRMALGSMTHLPETVLKTLDRDKADIKLLLHGLAYTALCEEDYHRTQMLCTALTGMEGAGLPCFEKAYVPFEVSGPALADYRLVDRGPGRYLLIEIAIILC